jgi:translation initiation factor IF-3
VDEHDYQFKKKHIERFLADGDKEVAEGTVSVRARAGGDQGGRPVDDFLRDAIDEVRRRAA